MGSDDNAKPQLTPEGKFALLLILCEFAVFAFFLCFGQAEMGMGAAICAAVFLIALRTTWALHIYRWYWGAIAVAIVLQYPFAFYFPWSSHAFRGTSLFPLGFLDFLLVWGCIKLTEKVMKMP